MTKEWKVICKDCGKPFGYSDSSYMAGLQRGLSRPERCPECRRRHAKEIQTLGMAFFKVKPINPKTIVEGVVAGDLGSIKHEERIHELTEVPSALDTSKFGITDEKLLEVFEKLNKHQIVVVVGPTGSGKSTYLPFRLLNPPAGIDPQIFTRRGQILVTQPRIQAAKNIPAYVAKVMHGSSIGAGFDIGFRHSDAPASDWRCKLVYVTDGTLINWIVSGQIGNLSVIMIDEAHERSLNIDLILGMLKRILPRYPNLKLIVASATIDHRKFINYFGGDEKVGFVEFEGKSYGVTPHYREELQKPTLNYDPNTVGQLASQIHKDVADQILDLLKRMYEEGGDLRQKRGDILAFLHGVKPIESAVNLVKEGIRNISELEGVVEVFPLYTTLSEKRQDDALGKPEWMKSLESSGRLKGVSQDEEEKIIREELSKSKRRVVITTNVAETSLTVHGILHVVDCGIINQDSWDSETQTKVVKPTLHSRAGCQQRWGRAGRLMAGDAYCLYTSGQFNDEEMFPGYSKPQILRAPLDQIVLTAKAAGIDDLTGFPWIDNPDDAELERAYAFLRDRKALDQEGDLTNHGLELQGFSDEPSIANLVVLSDRFGCAIEMATLIPIMKLGGYRRLLRQERDWDANTRRQVRTMQKSLTGNCHDDIEVCLKIYAAWDLSANDNRWSKTWAFRELWLSTVQQLTNDFAKGLVAKERVNDFEREVQSVTEGSDIDRILSVFKDKDELLSGWAQAAHIALKASRQAAWARIFFVEHNTLRNKIAKDRMELIKTLSLHKKEDEDRKINFDLIDKLRIVFAYGLQERLYKKSDTIDEDGNQVFAPLKLSKAQSGISAVISEHSVCYGKGLELFVAGRQQAVARKQAEGAGLVMICSFLGLIREEWLGFRELSLVELGEFISINTRQENGSFKIKGNWERLFLDQAFPIGSRFNGKIEHMLNEDYISVEVLSQIGMPLTIKEATRHGEAFLTAGYEEEEGGGELLLNTALEKTDVIIFDPEEEMEPPWIDLTDSAVEVLELDISCRNCGERNSFDHFYCKQCGSPLNVLPERPKDLEIRPKTTYLIGEKPVIGSEIGQLEVAEIMAEGNSELRIGFREVPNPEPFIAFLERDGRKVGDLIEVEVVGQDTFPGDYLVGLVVREVSSKFEILMEPKDIGFIDRGFIALAVPIGAKFKVEVVSIQPEYQRVQLNMHRFLDEYQAALFQRTREPVMEAIVADITDRDVFFVLGFGEPKKGIVVSGVSRNGLFGKSDDLKVGQKKLVRVTPRATSHKSLDELPEGLKKDLDKRKWIERLTWGDGQKKLTIEGLLSFYDLLDLLRYDSSQDYRNKIQDLYVFSNRLDVELVKPFGARGIIPRNKIGKLIGTKHENINKLRADTGTNIRIDERDMVVIEADEEDKINIAAAAINELLEISILFQPVKKPEAQLFELGEGRGTEKQESDVITRVMTIQQKSIGVLMGSKGLMINELQQKTQTRIELDSQTGEVTIEALTNENISKAIEMINEITSLATTRLRIATNQIGLLIGKERATINEISEKSSSKLDINERDGIVTITGRSAENISKARELVIERLSECTGSIGVPENKRGLLIGKRGSTIKSIGEQTNTRVFLDNSGEAKVIGKGRQSVISALERISKITGVDLLNFDTVRCNSPEILD